MPFHNRNNGNIHVQSTSKKSKQSSSLHTYFHSTQLTLSPHVTYFSYAKNIAQVYNYPSPTRTNTVFGVISLGGGLFGTLTGNILTNGDVQKYWTAQGLASPTVAIINVGSSNNPAGDLNSTIENTIDVATIGSCCPPVSSKTVTIIMYLAPNSFSGFYNVFNYAINTPVSVNGQMVKPSVISCSWGAPESAFGNTQLNRFNALFSSAVTNGINICCASGDNGSSDGLRGLNVDFPGSSPYVTSCGGTTLTCPTLNYTDPTTRETAWSGSGGGLSKLFSRPVYQTNLQFTTRAVPDIALDANPTTGIIYPVNNINYIVGGTSIVSPAVSAYIGAIGYTGFFTQKIYTLKSNAFHDIVAGSNGAYAAKAGYDNVTGLGSINGIEMQTEISNWIPVISITLNSVAQTISRRNTFQLIATVLSATATPTNPSVVWTTSNATVATVNQSGLVSANVAGTASISATTNDGWFRATCVCTVR